MGILDEFNRTRFIHHTVPRDPDGPVLEKNKGPIGFRVPNGFVWAHDIEELFLIPRIPSVPNYVTAWSRSMLKALGENYDRIEAALWEDPLVPPRVLRPWPVLKLPLDHPAQPEIPLGAIDEGCELEHSDFACYAIRANGSEYTEDGSILAYKRREPRRCPGGSDLSRPCTGRFVENSGSEPVKNSREKPYDYVWCSHFRARLEAAASSDEQSALISEAARGMIAGHIVADPYGVFLEGGRPPSPWFGTRHPVQIRAEAVDQDSDCVPFTYPGASGPSSARVHCDEEHPGLDQSTECATVVGLEDVDVDMEQVETPPPTVTADATQLVPPEDEVKQSEHTDLFSTAGLPKLEEFIPDALFPDILFVHDPDRATNHKANPSEPIKYRRVLFRLRSDVSSQNSSTSPQSDDDAMGQGAATKVTEERVAHLHIRRSNRLGEGHHSYVYRAPLTLPPPLSAHSRTGQVTVAAKLAFPHCTAHTLLHNEARVYSQFPRHLQEEYCGFNIVSPCYYPVPVGPVVPKFYGFYLPVKEDGSIDAGAGGPDGARHSHCYEDEPCGAPWLSPILLMEECGKPVEPERFTVDQRTECFSLVLRLHDLIITQGSFYVRNIMIQPGPLSWPPAERTYKEPSFRIIDFGRARCLALQLSGVTDKDERESTIHDIHRALWDEEKQAREELLVQDMGF
ncbi:hypothetical protein C8Q78DRAFT_1077726 [Trametes maxima]|nr:hypothetical protein C8Q78DRAFT_1077726 [Trametes maxima]